MTIVKISSRVNVILPLQTFADLKSHNSFISTISYIIFIQFINSIHPIYMLYQYINTGYISSLKKSISFMIRNHLRQPVAEAVGNEHL